MQRFHKKALELILRDNCRGMAEVREDGVWPSERAIESDPSQALLWRPTCDLDGPNVPDPLETPCLPIPFTPSELAAFMLSGIGAYLPSVYGDFQDGPDEGMLASFGPLGIKAKEALITAYAAYRQAQRSAGAFDRAPEIQADELADMYKKENHEAKSREGVFESEISAEEARERRARASASVTHLLERFDKAKRVADSTFTAWRKAMVRQLLQPQAAPVVAVGDGPVPLTTAPATDTAPPAPVAANSVSNSTTPDPERRLARLLKLGGNATYKNGKWKITGISALVACEKSESRKRSDEKTVRADLKEAAENEREAKRANAFSGLGQR